MQATKRSAFSVEDKCRHVCKWKESHKSKREYAKANGISKSSFCDWVDDYEAGKYSDVMVKSVKKIKSSAYPQVEQSLVKYIELRRSLLSRDKCGLSWISLKSKAVEFAEKLLSDEEYREFRSSDGWLDRTLKRHNLIGVNLHGESGDMSHEEAEQKMECFRREFATILDANKISLDRVWNADQSGLYYQKLPNHIYCNPEERVTLRGVKLMKDKSRITLMFCSSPTGDKIPIAVVGTSKRPQCWDQCDNNPPCPYTHQRNAWFDQKVFIWWLTTVYAVEMRKRFGNNKVVLLLDNCPAHVGIENNVIPSNIIIVFLPANMTALYQPADQGMIAILKLGYKHEMLSRLLRVCDDPVTYANARELGSRQRAGCRGLAYGNKPTLLDAMEILHDLWNPSEGRYSNRDLIQRCWRKANCLPLLQDIEYSSEVGHRDRSEKKIDSDLLDDLCASMHALSHKVNNLADVPDFIKDSLITDSDGVSAPQYREVVEYWCNVEDDPAVINSEIDEAAERLENAVVDDELSENAIEEPEQAHFVESALSNAEVDQLLLMLSRWGNSMISEARKRMATRMIREIQHQRLERPTVQSSLDMFFYSVSNGSNSSAMLRFN